MPPSLLAPLLHKPICILIMELGFSSQMEGGMAGRANLIFLVLRRYTKPSAYHGPLK